MGKFDCCAILSGSGPCRADDKIQTGLLGEGSEITVPRDQRNPAIDTALGNEGIAEPGFAAFRAWLMDAAKASARAV